MKRSWVAGMICLLMVSFGYSQEGEKQEMVSIRGCLIRIAAIGGETTGWVVDLDAGLQVEGKMLYRVEIDPIESDQTIDSSEGKQVRIEGTLQKRQGIERKEYWVVRVEHIEVIRNP